MAEAQADGPRGGEQEELVAPVASEDPEIRHEKAMYTNSHLRLAIVEQRLRAHGFMVTTQNYIDPQEAICSGKIIMAVGSDEDMKAEAEVAAQDPDKYSSGVECELAIGSGEVYMWLLRVGDKVTYDPRLMRGTSVRQPKRAASTATVELETFAVGDKVLVPVLDMYPGGTLEDETEETTLRFFFAAVSSILIVVPAKGTDQIDYTGVPEGYFSEYSPVKGERTTQVTVFLYLSSTVLDRADGSATLAGHLDEVQQAVQGSEACYHPTCIVCNQ